MELILLKDVDVMRTVNRKMLFLQYCFHKMKKTSFQKWILKTIQLYLLPKNLPALTVVYTRYLIIYHKLFQICKNLRAVAKGCQRTVYSGGCGSKTAVTSKKEFMLTIFIKGVSSTPLKNTHPTHFLHVS